MAGEIVTVFRNRVRDEAWAEYEPVAERMAELAEAMPGFVERKTFTAEDGRFYSEYRLQVCVLESERRFTRPS